MKILNGFEQGTKEWHDARRAMITGTRLDSVMGTNWDKLQLICELISEEASEKSKDYKVTPSMERGTAEETFARKNFEKETKKKVKQIGFCVSDEFPFLGCSGDGWIENNKVIDEAIEIKSPDTDTAVFYKLSSIMSPIELGLGTWTKPSKVNPEPVFNESAKVPFCGIPANYVWQVTNYFLVNEKLNKLYFIVWDPRFIDDKSKMYTVVVTRKQMQPKIDEAKKELVTFRKFWIDCRNKIINDEF